MADAAFLTWLSKQPQALFKFRHGLEKEGLRVDATGRISQKGHPAELGSALTHPLITTDYSEALLEFITPAVDSPEASMNCLRELHQFALQVNPDENIWPASMPSVLDGELSVPIAEYGSSHIGQLKHIYRHGLWHRYGRIMQTIAGVHFNYSVPDEFWPAWQAFKGDTDSLVNFQSRRYFGLIRHFRRHSWLLLYLFGASPALDRTFLRENTARLRAQGTYTLMSPTATTLRMSDMGYTNSAQQSLKVCFNSLPTYIKTLRQALHTPYPPYEAMGIKQDGRYQQLNANILQIENEYYSDIRPKRTTRSGEKPLQALEERGVEYIEVRCLDLNPYLPLGVDSDQLHFMNWFLFWCLTEEAPEISDIECERVEFNKKLTVLYGRDPELLLVDRGAVRSLREWGKDILSGMESLLQAVQPDNAVQVQAAITRYRAMLAAPETTPSGQMAAALANDTKDYRTLVARLAAEHRDTLLAEPLSADRFDALAQEAELSIAAQDELEQQTTGSFDAFVQSYINR
ncbi:glutamate--cysteine ligase [Salinispirillum sp. LH 10-3-1]|uniref:Glutamate--cysteine ligase n=1 Tax=Salinispirillum sp. LH 10-3-1 TaxID=2952525 RepID=A0AB38YH60_9GAMM